MPTHPSSAVREALTQSPLRSLTQLPHHLSQVPVIERLGTDWIIWLNYNRDLTRGTYLILKPDGSIFRQTEEDHAQGTILIKPPEPS